MEEEFYSIEYDNGWSRLFQRLNHTARLQVGSQLEGKKPSNHSRNRYRDVIPVDEYRVKLNDDNCDYINASFVEVEDVKRKYILCQGPLEHTCHHFWQMVWEQKSTGIIMLNKCIERGVSKCYQYWPVSLHESILEVAQYKIELVCIEDFHTYRMSTLQLEDTESDEEPRTILHFHYTRWPDFGVPQTPDDFLDFLDSVKRSGVLNESVGPAVVHCSAGIGRSGTFCLVDVCLKKIELTSDSTLSQLKLQPILQAMRQQRLGLVQTADQLRFCYIAILQTAFPDQGDSDEEEVEDSDSEEEVGVGSGTVGATSDIYSERNLDLPPPIPPRYPDMLDPKPSSPPPPPPPTLPPPGPPEYSNLADDDSGSDLAPNGTYVPEDIDEIIVEYERRDSNEMEIVKELAKPWYMNGDMEANQTGVPPSPPPRHESVFREKESPSHAGHFLGLERGGERWTPPRAAPPTPLHTPTPAQSNRPEERDHRINEFNEEEALIKELNELEKIVSQAPKTKQSPIEVDEAAVKAKEVRKKEREERQRRLNDKVILMKDKIKQENNTRDWSTSWAVLGAVVIASYCVYYYLS